MLYIRLSFVLYLIKMINNTESRLMLPFTIIIVSKIEIYSKEKFQVYTFNIE